MEKIIYPFLTIIVGMFISLHLAMNGKLGEELRLIAGTPIKAAGAANFFFWIIGAIFAALYFFLSKPGSPLTLLSASTKPLLISGALGASIVFAVTYLIPGKVGGAGPGFLYLMAGQVLIGVLLSHFGFLGSPVDPVTIKKITGLIIIFTGMYLVVI